MSVTHGVYHVGKTQTATICRIVMCQRHFTPPVILRPAQANRAIEAIGIGRADRTLRSVDLDKGQVMMPYIETGDDRADRAARKIHDACDVCRRIDGYNCASFSRAGYDTLRGGDFCRG